jgi:hypothetical protein
MAVRLSLSFPGLLSAIPMYTMDEYRDGAQTSNLYSGADFVARKVYFSDGGITSNCPIQLFDAPLPTRPTYGVHLFPAEKSHSVWMRGAGPDPEPRLAEFATKPTIKAAIGFVAAIVGTAIDWRDAVQRDLPGYRERIVRVGVPSEEGGLNLAMPAPTIKRVAAYGVEAADLLAGTFARPAEVGVASGWEVHRWVRLRSTLFAARRYLGAMAEKIRAGTPHYLRVSGFNSSADPRFLDGAAVAQAEALMVGIERLAEDVGAATPSSGLSANCPEPAPVLRMSSPW